MRFREPPPLAPARAPKRARTAGRRGARPSAAFEGLVVVAYDIRSHRLRARVAEVLADYGGVRVQKSVFECELTPSRLAALRLRLSQLVTSTRDSVRFYRLCEACRARVEGTALDQRPRAAAPVIV